MLSMRRMLVAAVVACAAFVSLASAAAATPAAQAQLAGTTGMPPFTIAAWRWIDIWQNDAADYEAYVTNKQYHNVVRPLHTRATFCPAPSLIMSRSSHPFSLLRVHVVLPVASRWFQGVASHCASSVAGCRTESVRDNPALERDWRTFDAQCRRL
jgi:hypothetical protein